MKTRNITNILQFPLIVFCFIISFNLNAQISCKAVCNQEKGWMPNGWGSYTISVKNESKDTIALSGWEIHWKNEERGKFKELNKKLAPAEVWEKAEIGYLSQSIVDNSGKKAPVMVGRLLAQVKDKEKEILFKLTIPAAYLPEPTKTLKRREYWNRTYAIAI